MTTYCGHSTTRPIHVCRACQPLYDRGLLPLYDGKPRTAWRRREYVPIIRVKVGKKNNCLDCGKAISPQATRCRVCNCNHKAANKQDPNAERNAIIRQRVASGEPRRKVAEHMGISPNRVRALTIGMQE